MARPAKPRRICMLPPCTSFVPDTVRDAAAQPPVVLTLDEYECLRLIDYEGADQATCADAMEVARTTVQAVYASARQKLARALVCGLPLTIQGGSYETCKGPRPNCCCATRLRHGCPRIFQQKRSENTMKLAVTYSPDGQIFQHFGKTQAFKVYTIEHGAIQSAEVKDTEGQGHGALAGMLKDWGVDTLLCGGMGMGAQNALTAAGIDIYAGCTGAADDAVRALLAGELTQNDTPTCDHHHGVHTCHA
ncbi:MAG: NifB/NifX family molybdenum-iron cluster-binding protein [Selenomonadaceae bacterium]|nr:DUF134 domain-containing protein [Selenomonadaceae bacterium]MDY3916217.1 NifB/NifX family molybdenum-iron cluster-binding protein [Selenomonadaceae bacterium]